MLAAKDPATPRGLPLAATSLFEFGSATAWILILEAGMSNNKLIKAKEQEKKEVKGFWFLKARETPVMRTADGGLPEAGRDPDF